MKVEEFVRLIRNSGLEISSTGSAYFYRQGWINYSYPTLVKTPIKNHLVQSVRWKYPISLILTDLRRKNTYEFVLHTDDYAIDKFAKKIRNRIRKSLQNCTFKRPSLEDMLTFGLKINQDTLKRQNRRDTVLTNANKWKIYITSLYAVNDIIMLGAFYANRMVGYIVATELEEKYIICHAFIDRNDSEITDPMNGLIFTLVNQLIEKDKTVRISYGLDSFTTLAELNRFKSNMLFERIPVSRVYIINPLLLPFIKLAIFFYMHVLQRKNFKSDFPRQLIRLYQGHRLCFRECKPCLQTPDEQMENI
jgi:hypothetical protein